MHQEGFNRTGHRLRSNPPNTMNYTYMLNMDNDKAESCDVVVKFTANDASEFDGFISIVSEPPLYSDDLAYLEEWVIQGKEQWEPTGTFSHTNRERM